MAEDMEALVQNLISADTESETVEFKKSNADPEMIAKDISALSNSAALRNVEYGYMIWGIDDGTHAIIGTTFDPYKKKKSNQELNKRLRQKLSNNVEFEFIKAELQGSAVWILRVSAARNYPASFSGKNYVRSGTSTHPIAQGSEMEGRLWDKVRASVFEDATAAQWLDSQEIFAKLNWNLYFLLTDTPLPEKQEEIIDLLRKEHILVRHDSGQYSITNLGAILFANDLSAFGALDRKALRIIKYDRDEKSSPSRMFTFHKGYADFESMLIFITALLPERDEIAGGLRKTVNGYPVLALRELVANMLIHQDFNIQGAGPMIDIFPNRIVLTNPGSSLIAINRLVNDPPRSRNQGLAKLARRLRICEEAGSGWDKIISECEFSLLPAPEIRESKEGSPSIEVQLRSHIPFKNLSTEERVASCYWHACIKYANGGNMTNTSLRERFGLSRGSTSQISRLIRECSEADLIRPVDEDAGKKGMKYIPSWA